MKLLKISDTEKIAVFRTDLDDASAKTIQNEIANQTCRQLAISTIKALWKNFFHELVNSMKQESGIVVPNNDATELIKIIHKSEGTTQTTESINEMYGQVVSEFMTFSKNEPMYNDSACANNSFSLDTITKDTNSMMYAGGILAIGGIIGYFIGKK